MRIGDTEYRAKKGDMLVVRPWEEVYGVPCKNKEYGRYLHIAVKKEFFTEVAAEAAEEGKFMDQDEAEAYFAKLNDLGISDQGARRDHELIDLEGKGDGFELTCTYATDMKILRITYYCTGKVTY